MPIEQDRLRIHPQKQKEVTTIREDKLKIKKTNSRKQMEVYKVKRKLFSVLLTAAFVTGLILIPAAPAAAADITVGSGKTHATIQAAIDAASATGDEIKVYPGTYTETLDIDKQVTLTGVDVNGDDNWTGSIAGAGGTAPTITWATAAHQIAINEDSVTIQGFNIDTASGAGASRGIFWTGSRSDSVIQYCSFEGDPGDNLICLSDDKVATDFTVTYNTFTGDGTGAGIGWFGMGANGGSAGTNVISYNEVTLGPEGGVIASSLNIGTNDIDSITYSNNSLTHAIWFQEDPEQSTGKIGDILIEDNTFAGAPSTNAVDIQVSVEDADFEGGSFGATDVIVTGNDFSGYVNGGGLTVDFAVTNPSASLNAENNWWGSANGPVHATNVFNMAAQLTDDAADVSDNVDFTPWYDTSMTATSFAPVINFTDTTYFPSIQAAIDATGTVDGETIYVLAGIYTETLDIHDQLTLTGRNLANSKDAWTVGTAGTDGASSSAPTITWASAAHQIAINEDSVTIQGFNIDTASGVGASRGIFWTGSRSTSRIQYCSFEGDPGDNLICLSDDKVATDFTVTYNTFTGDGTGAGIGWFGMGANGGSAGTNVISYNEVTLGPEGGVIASSLNIGTNDIDSITYSNNSLTHAIWFQEDPEQSTGKIGDIVIVGNVFAGAPSTNAVQIQVSVENADFEGNAFDATDVVVYYNDFSGYADGDVDGDTIDFAVTSPGAYLDARYNYWGSALDGPTVAANTNGTGPDISANVTYDPWLYKTLATDGDTTPEIYANQVPAYVSSVDLSSGWNTWSVPIGLDGQYNTWAELYDLTSLPYTFAYRFDVTSQTFVALLTTSTYAIVPGEAFYIKLTAADSIPYAYSTAFSMPSRALGDGFNLVGGGLTTDDEIITLASIATVANTAGFTQVISTAENAASPWLWTTGDTTTSQGDLVLGEGYWVFLPIDRTLGLFDPTPVAWIAVP